MGSVGEETDREVDLMLSNAERRLEKWSVDSTVEVRAEEVVRKRSHSTQNILQDSCTVSVLRRTGRMSTATEVSDGLLELLIREEL